MKRLFCDTNVILDFLIREEYQPNIRKLIADSSGKDLYISYLTIANAAYIMRKYPKSQITGYISLLIKIFKVIPNTVEQIIEAIKIEAPDFEDMLQYQSAIASKCDVILTRNCKDFPYSNIPVMTVEEYLNL